MCSPCHIVLTDQVPAVQPIAEAWSFIDPISFQGTRQETRAGVKGSKGKEKGRKGSETKRREREGKGKGRREKEKEKERKKSSVKS